MLAVRFRYGDIVSDEYMLPLAQSEQKLVQDIVKNEKKMGLPVTIDSATSSVRALPFYLKGLDYGEYQIEKEVNFIAERIAHLTMTEQDLFSAVLELEQPESLKEIINLSYNLDSYELVQDVTSDQHKGVPCQTGFVVKREGIFPENLYTDYLPDPGFEKDSLFLLHLYHEADNQIRYYALAIPANEEKMKMAMQALGITDFSMCTVNQYGGPKDHLKPYLPIGSSVDDLNRFSMFLKESVLDGSEKKEKRLAAALEAECPRNLEEVTNIARNLDRYTIYTDLKTPEDYARFLVKNDGAFLIAPFCMEYADLEAIGNAAMKRYGTILTKLGIVSCDDWCCERLPEHIVTTRLFSPLSGEYEDYEGYQSSLSEYSLWGYDNEIKAVIEKNWLYEQKKGLAEYLDNQLLKQRVISMFPTVEAYQYRLWGVLEVKSWGELSPEELEVIKREWEGQAADGWGESFEQRGIDFGSGGTLYVHFWNIGTEIQTEQELKGIDEVQEDIQMGGIQ